MFADFSNFAGLRLVLWGVITGTILTVSAARLAAQFPAENRAKACSREHFEDSAKVGRFFFRTYKNDESGEACLQVVRDGEVLFRRTYDNGGEFTIGQPVVEDRKVAEAIPNGTDITGRGRPDMIVSFYTGGAHCCVMHYVFELEPVFKLLATLDAEDSYDALFSDIDHNRHYYYLANDWTFAYWQASFAESPSPTVILRFEEDTRGGGYHLALDKMRRPAPTAAEWDKAMQEASTAFTADNPFSGGIGPELWRNMLDFIYNGHSSLAWKLFDEAWPAARPGKGEFLSGFCSQLKISPYWPDLEKAIPNAPPICATAKPKDCRFGQVRPRQSKP